MNTKRLRTVLTSPLWSQDRSYMFRSIAITFGLLLATANAQAALQGRAPLTPGGTDYQAVYDSTQKITWLANANLPASQPFGVAGIEPSGGFNGAGSMHWDAALAWVAAMNSNNWLGVSNWRLPAADPACSGGIGCTTSELGHLYIVDGITPATPGPFSNITSGPNTGTYWDGTPFADPSFPYNGGYDFNFNNVSQGGGGTQSAGCGGPYSCNAWPVVDGDPFGCMINPADVRVRAVGPYSRDGKPTTMQAQFTPHDANGAPVGLEKLRTQCGYTNFDFQQRVTSWPAPPGELVPNVPQYVPQNISSDGFSLTAPPEFSDPVPGGYTYSWDSFPFYYPLNLLNALSLVPCTLDLPIKSDVTLTMQDCPRDFYLAGFPSNRRTLSFRTSLVGVEDSPPLPPSVQPGTPSQPYKTWAWTSTFNGTSATNGRGGVQTASVSPLDPNSGTGGVVITSIDGVPQTPPNAACSATLLNANEFGDDRPVLATVSGRVTAGTSPIPSGATSFVISDREREERERHAQRSGTVTIEPDGTFSFVVPLWASREADKEEEVRKYTITVTATDVIGNQGACSVTIALPRHRDEQGSDRHERDAH